MNAFDFRARFPGFELAAAAAWSARRAALFGASGSGKSTILEALAGLRPEVAGEATLGGRRVDGLPSRERRVGWVPQDAALFPHMTAGENVEFAVRARGDGAAARRAIDALEIGDLLDRPATALSGGERQRVAIARALASGATFLLLDEPLSAIDRPLRTRVLPFLERIETPFLFVGHDPLEVAALADHVIVLEGGRVAAAGHPSGVFASAAAFGALHALGAENVFDVRVIERGEGTLRLETERGLALEMASVPGFAGPARVAIRSEEIVLATGEWGPISTRNRLRGAVLSVESVGGHALVRVAAEGETFVAKVTASAVHSLALAPGAAVTLLVKAHAVLPLT